MVRKIIKHQLYHIHYPYFEDRSISLSMYVLLFNSYDIRFPELAQCLIERGCGILIYPGKNFIIMLLELVSLCRLLVFNE